MKILFESPMRFNREYDFVFEDPNIMDLSFVEPEEPRLLKEIGVDYITDEITKRDRFNCSFRESPLTRQLLPEQIRVLLSHAHKIWMIVYSKSQFIRIFHNEVKQIAEQEIEPGM
ncbi:MAG: hypothetical protein ACXACY_21690, partial [Candidatus Hodarchaeales archaeon]